jgi:hypothetical protein
MMTFDHDEIYDAKVSAQDNREEDRCPCCGQLDCVCGDEEAEDRLLGR